MISSAEFQPLMRSNLLYSHKAMLIVILLVLFSNMFLMELNNFYEWTFLDLTKICSNHLSSSSFYYYFILVPPLIILHVLTLYILYSWILTSSFPASLSYGHFVTNVHLLL